MSTGATVSEVAGWPESIALILWAVVALAALWLIYEAYEAIQSGADTLASWINSLFGSSGGNGNGGVNSAFVWYNPLTWWDAA